MTEDWESDEWIRVFQDRKVWDLNRVGIGAWLDANELFFATVARHVPPAATVLELGCGPGRHAISLAVKGYHAIGVDQNPLIVEQARRNSIACGVETRATFLVGDMNALDDFIDDDIAAVTHGGVLEHLPSVECIRSTIASQLSVSPVVVFDVPLGTEKNLQLFSRDTIFRQAWTPEEWIGVVLESFDVREWHIVLHEPPFMTDDLVVALSATRG